MQEDVKCKCALTQKPLAALHARPHRSLCGGSNNSDGGVKVKCCQQYGSLATEGFNQPCSMSRKGMATLPKMSVTNVQPEHSEGCVLLEEEGGMTRNERVEDKEMDGAGQETEKGNGQR